ncbi:uncharacterized protein LOC119136396 [Syngnathus acus]|uniref:uncharacterized protein LOC119136396 n=1 Tax=Syngnathus acus TaxID=161584 RepID=UPI001885EB1D|nr:uncharacterized protein LOC119136396 [Syngnathus acus]
MRKSMNLLLLLILIQVLQPSSAQNASTVSANTTAGILIPPVDVSVFVGDPAVFTCAVPETSPAVTFNLSGGHGNYSLTCPGGRVEDIPQALYGSCLIKNGQSLAVWTFKGTSNSDNNTRVVCQLPNNLDRSTATLRIYDNGSHLAILIGCAIGAFFGILLVFALLYVFLQRSEGFRKCFRRKEDEDDVLSIIAKDVEKKKEKD